MTNIEIIKKIFSSYIETTGVAKFILVVIFGFFVSFIAYVEPLFFTQIIKTIEEFLKTGNFDLSELIRLMIYWLIFIVVSVGTSLIYRYYFVVKKLNFSIQNLSTKYTKNIINMTFPAYLSKETGSIYKIFDRGIEYHFQFLFFFFLDLIKGAGGIFLVITILLYHNITMTFITLSLLPVMIIMGLFFFKKLSPIQRKLDDKWDAIYADLGNIMSVFSLVKTLSIEKTFLNKVEKKLDFCVAEQNKISRGWTIADLYTSAITTISRFIVIGAGVYFVINGKITFSTLFLFFSYIGWIYFPLGSLFGRLGNVQSWIKGIGKFYEQFDNLESEYNKNIGKKIKNIKGSIEFKNVSFGYSDKNIINNLSFKIKDGEKIAFVGDTGAGKSTIVSLFLRFWNINKGEILVDDININKINLKSFRKHIGVVSQDSSLFNLSIKENLLFANPKATKKELENALKKAEANFVFDLKNGLNTVIGERGLKLSGGEKQRLSIARLFLKNPEILILDEATSALDTKTEKSVQKALENLMKGRTSIVIAHRLSTVKNADRIFVIKAGKIIEEGNYNKLLKDKGIFYNLVNPESLKIY